MLDNELSVEGHVNVMLINEEIILLSDFTTVGMSF